MTKKIFCKICDNEEFSPGANFCKICGASLRDEETNDSRYEIIIRDKKKDKEIQRTDCDGAAVISFMPTRRKDSVEIMVGMIGLNPVKQIMAADAINDAIQKHAKEEFENMDEDLFDKITQKIRSEMEKEILRNSNPASTMKQ